VDLVEIVLNIAPPHTEQIAFKLMTVLFFCVCVMESGWGFLAALQVKQQNSSCWHIMRRASFFIFRNSTNLLPCTNLGYEPLMDSSPFFSQA
jgi:hypothetical protein